MTSEPADRGLPTGTVTFLFTDIEGSTRLVQEIGDDRYRDVLETHYGLIRKEIEDNNGVEIRTEGDAVFAVFASAPDGVAAAAAAQQALAAQPWPDEIAMRVRMGLHTGTATLGGADYLGLDVHRAARIADAAHGGQILVSKATASLAAQAMGSDVRILDLGVFQLKDVGDETLYQVTATGVPGDFPPPRASGPAPSLIPRPQTSFVGREAEVADVTSLLASHRLITLTGPGGTGKTRLSLEVVESLEGRYRDGIFFVELSDLEDPDLLADAILSTLGLQSNSVIVEPEDHLVSYLTGKESLLVLDNFEHLIEAHQLVGRIISTTESVSILVTSRVPLRVGGEREMTVPPLGTDSGDTLSEGARLFLDRAQTVRPGFAPEPDELTAIEALVERLDGLPLAIELAASRLRVLPPEEILTRLHNKLLATRSGDLPSRQKTIDSTIGWSFDLLTEPAQRLFARLSVFAGGASLEELDRVCRDNDETNVDVIDNLEELIEQSLVTETRGSGPARFSMLHVIREFAYETLVSRDEEGGYRNRHTRVFTELVEAAHPEMLTGARLKWLNRLSEEHNNIRAALDWAVDSGDSASALKIAAGMWRYWQTRGPLPEAKERVTQALGMPGDHPILRARALEAAGGIAYWIGDLEAMEAPYAEAVSILREHGSEDDLSLALYNLSFPLTAQGRYDEASDALDESEQLAQSTDDRYAAARVFWGRFNLAWYQGDKEDAVRQSELAMAAFEPLDAPFDLGWSRYALGDSLMKIGRLAEARKAFRDGILTFAEAYDLPALILFLSDFAALEVMSERRDRAARILGAVQTIRRQIGMSLWDTAAWEEADKEVRELLGEVDDEYTDFQEGTTMSPSQAVAYAVED